MMDELKKTGPWGTSFKWGIIAGIVGVLVAVLTSMGDVYTSTEDIEKAQDSPIRYLSWLITVVGVILAQREHRFKELGGFMSYGRSVGVATITGLAAGVIGGIYMYYFVAIQHPEFQQLIIDGSLEKAYERDPNMSPETEEQMIKWTRMFTGPAMMSITSVIGSAVLGLVAGLITGIFIQKSEPGV